MEQRMEESLTPSFSEARPQSWTSDLSIGLLMLLLELSTEEEG